MLEYIVLIIFLFLVAVFIGSCLYAWLLRKSKKYITRRGVKEKRTRFIAKLLLGPIILFAIFYYLIPYLILLCDIRYKHFYDNICQDAIYLVSRIYNYIKLETTAFFTLIFNAIIAAAIFVFWMQNRSLTKQLQAAILYNFNETNRLLWQGATNDPRLCRCFLTQDDWASESEQVYFLSQRVDWFEYVFMLYDQGIISNAVWKHWGQYFKKLLLTEPKFRELMLRLDSRDYYDNFFHYAQKIIDQNDFGNLKEIKNLNDNPEWQKIINKECLYFSKVLKDIAMERNIDIAVRHAN